MTPAPTWLSGETAALRAAHTSGRLPHALMIHEAPGAGGEWLAVWAAQLVLCEKADSAPCGSCTACRRAALLQHPDLNWVQPLEDSRQIRIEQGAEDAGSRGFEFAPKLCLRAALGVADRR